MTWQTARHFISHGSAFSSHFLAPYVCCICHYTFLLPHPLPIQCGSTTLLQFFSSDQTLCHIQSLLISGFSHKQETKFLFFISSINAGPHCASRLINKILSQLCYDLVLFLPCPLNCVRKLLCNFRSFNHCRVNSTRRSTSLGD